MSVRFVADPRDPDRPFYARLLRLRHVDPGGVVCFVLCEAMVALGALLALAELVPWWGVLALPAAVAVMVKLNDLIAGAVSRRPGRGHGARRCAGRYGGAGVPERSWDRAAAHWPANGGGAQAHRVVGSARVGGRAHGRPWPATPGDETTTLGLAHSLNVLNVDNAASPQQRARQSAVRRYE